MHSVKSFYKKISENRLIKALGPFSVLIVITLIFSILTPTFRTPANLASVGLSASVYVILAMGMTFVIISGGIDLSLGSIVGLAGAFCCILLKMQMPVWAAALGGMLMGMVCGAINGFMVTWMGLLPFIATLGGQWIFRGVLLVMSGGATVTVRSDITKQVLDDFIFLGSGRILGIPVPVYIFAVLGIALSFLLKHTTYGRSLYAIGSNPEAARMSGIHNNRIKFKTYVLAGTLAGLSGVLLAARMVSMTSGGGNGYEFEGIFATVVGGTSMSGGEGSVLGAICGAFVVAILRNGLNLNGINSFWQQVILGGIIVIAVYVDTLRTRKAK